MKSIFNGGEVNYLTILFEDLFHVFLNTDVVQLMGERFEVVNSKAIKQSDFDDQKVLFRYEGQNVGELEMRKSSPTHYPSDTFGPGRPVPTPPTLAAPYSAFVLTSWPMSLSNRPNTDPYRGIVSQAISPRE